jgi:hypothetical protein
MSIVYRSKINNLRFHLLAKTLQVACKLHRSACRLRKIGNHFFVIFISQFHHGFSAPTGYVIPLNPLIEGEGREGRQAQGEDSEGEGAGRGIASESGRASRR